MSRTNRRSFIQAAAALLLTIAAAFLVSACAKKQETPPPAAALAADPRLEGSFREDRDGWAFVHLEGAPADIGFQHGWHLAAEIEDILKTMAF
jgi:FtsP/CotA-like multicopper oxidase with cupredoxin domain